jgi:putative ABC transport system substrate-binding protein
MIDRRRFIDALTSVAAVAPVAASAQPASRMYRIGYIQTATAEEQEHLTRALEEALRARGYVEGRNVVFERRFADGRQERLPELAAELVRLNVDVIVTGGNPVIFAVKRATGTIPVVMAASRDPVGSGFIASLAAPGGNITGVTSDAASGIVGKHLQILKEVLPRASRMAVLWNPDPPGAVNYRREVESAARILGVQLQVVEARARNQFDGAFDAMARERCDAVVVQADPLFFTARRQIVDLAARHRLPAIYHAREVVELGGLMSYGVSLASQFRRAAVYVGKILEGAKPGDLPVEQPTTFELVINLKTGKSLGIAIPQNLLLRADEIIE